MREALLPLLRCPRCRREHSLELTADGRTDDEREIREATLHCSACGQEFPVRGGIVDLLHEPPEHIVREAAGLERFAQVMRDGGWDADMIRKLPDVDLGYWFVQARSMEHLHELVEFRPGQRLLDVGSNTCWASNRFAQEGLEVVAMDIATVDLQGLGCADHFFAADPGRHFERVTGTMVDLPLASATLDYVFCCQVLHHNDPAELPRAFAEAFRVLRPGGRMLVLNETLRSLRDWGGVHDEEVREFEGYEHAYFAHQYVGAARRAGFRHIRPMAPLYQPFFSESGLHIPPGTPAWRAVRQAIGYGLRERRLARLVYAGWLTLVRGNVQLSMICTKPG